MAEDRLSDTTFTFLDVETTGLFPAFGDRICEIALLKWRIGSELDSFSTLVNPHRHISPGAQAVNGISDNMVTEAPDFGDIVRDVFRMVGNSVIVAHNAGFDLGFLADECGRNNIPTPDNKVLDTLRLARSGYSFPNNSLNAIVSFLGLQCRPCHRAMADVRATKALLEYFLNDFATRGITSLSGLLEYQGGSAAWPELRQVPLPPALEDALRNRQPLTIKYISATGEETTRMIQPLQAMLKEEIVYLRAYCHLREEERIFRLDRIAMMQLEFDR